MRIISKYKDFYDYLVQDHNPDLVWVRKPDTASISDHKKYYDLGVGINRDMSRRDIDTIKLSYEVFGIYPYIYVIPLAGVTYNSFVGVDKEYIVLSREIFNDLLNGDESTIVDYVLNNASEHLLDSLSFRNSKLKYVKTIRDLNRIAWKKECPEIFKELGAPVFCEYHSVGLPDEYRSIDWASKDYVINPVFSKFSQNILRYWFDELNNINTYNNIENFLWSVKSEPISEPDNKTKIVSHGFDLKTSFRKM